MINCLGIFDLNIKNDRTFGRSNLKLIQNRVDCRNNKVYIEITKTK